MGTLDTHGNNKIHKLQNQLSKKKLIEEEIQLNLTDVKWKALYDEEYKDQERRLKGQWALKHGNFDGFDESSVKAATLE